MEGVKEFGTVLEVKECDLRKDLFTQCRYAVDRGIHIGGAQSAVAPMTALYYGGFFRYDVQNPTTEEQDVFILSKGHAVSTLAAVYADLGYFPKDDLKGSRGWGALIKGHPGPSMPGVPVATGPLGHGIGIGCGYALRQKETGNYNTYVLTGDGELQEGSCWESIMFACAHRLNNLCVIVDMNNGQSDDTRKTLQGNQNLRERFEAFGFRVMIVDSSEQTQLLACLETFNSCPRDCRPTAIICESYKGFGGFSSENNKHKTAFSDEECDYEVMLLERRRRGLIKALSGMDSDKVKAAAQKAGYRIDTVAGALSDLVPIEKPVAVKRAALRSKALKYDEGKLPKIMRGQSFAPTDLAAAFSKVFAESPDFYTIDADLSNVSGLFTGTSMRNCRQAINAGIAECNMMLMAEGLAAAGANVWVSTFGPFFDMQAFRRIAVSYQERLEAIEEKDGWLSEGHNLDITFLSTASNVDSGVNGATHMSNDDANVIVQLAHVKVIDVSCPAQFLSVAKWIAQGGKGLVYLRVMRYASPAIYDYDFQFEYGKGYFPIGAEDADVAIVTSGHGVLEALEAVKLLAQDGVGATVIDMPSYDGALLRRLTEKGCALFFAEQNNGLLFDLFSRDLLMNHFTCDVSKVHHINARDKHNQARFLQSGTYEQIIDELGLSPEKIAERVERTVQGRSAGDKA